MKLFTSDFLKSYASMNFAHLLAISAVGILYEVCKSLIQTVKIQNTITIAYTITWLPQYIYVIFKTCDYSSGNNQ